MDSVNITIFFVVAALVYLLETRWLREATSPCVFSKRFVLLVLLALAAVFVVFTFFPPDIPLFADPRTTQ